MEQMLLPILMFGGLGAMMYFGMRKQKRQVAETKRMQESVVPGTRVMTTSGLHGTVTAVADDTIELEIAPEVRTTWVRAAVREVIVPGPTDETLDADGYETGSHSIEGETIDESLDRLDGQLDSNGRAGSNGSPVDQNRTDAVRKDLN